jgi:hypothetical protein
VDIKINLKTGYEGVAWLIKSKVSGSIKDSEYLD